MVDDEQPLPEDLDPADDPDAIPPVQQPDARTVAIEQDLLDLPGVQSATLAGDRWLVHLRDGADPEDIPRRIGDRQVEVARLE